MNVNYVILVLIINEKIYLNAKYSLGHENNIS